MDKWQISGIPSMSFMPAQGPPSGVLLISSDGDHHMGQKSTPKKTPRASPPPPPPTKEKQRKPYLKSSHTKKKILAKFSYQKNFKPQKRLWSFPSLEIQCTPLEGNSKIAIMPNSSRHTVNCDRKNMQWLNVPGEYCLMWYISGKIRVLNCSSWLFLYCMCNVLLFSVYSLFLSYNKNW